MTIMERTVRELPRYRCHKEVNATKIEQVIIHALPFRSTPEQDEAFIASSAFEGGHIFPADKALAIIPIDAEWYRKHKPEEGGYYVVYSDGYASYSPAKAFEEGYTKI